MKLKFRLNISVVHSHIQIHHEVDHILDHNQDPSFLVEEAAVHSKVHNKVQDQSIYNKVDLVVHVGIAFRICKPISSIKLP